MITWLNVPYKENNLARLAGAKWSMSHKRWYAENLENLEPLLRWIPEHLKKPVKAHSKNPIKAKKSAEEIRAFFESIKGKSKDGAA